MAKIVVIDDNVDMRELICTCVRLEGHDAVTADDGLVGLDVVRAQEPDLIVLDWMMPRMDGLDVARVLRAEPRFAQVPILLVTAAAALPPEVEPRLEDVDAVLRKPFNLRDLTTLVTQLLRPQPST